MQIEIYLVLFTYIWNCRFVNTDYKCYIGTYKNGQISEIKNKLFPSDYNLKIRFKCKNMFRETIIHK